MQSRRHPTKHIKSRNLDPTSAGQHQGNPWGCVLDSPSRQPAPPRPWAPDLHHAPGWASACGPHTPSPCPAAQTGRGTSRHSTVAERKMCLEDVVLCWLNNTSVHSKQLILSLYCPFDWNLIPSICISHYIQTCKAFLSKAVTKENIHSYLHLLKLSSFPPWAWHPAEPQLHGPPPGSGGGHG